MEFDNIVEKELGDCRGRSRLGGGDEVGHFGEAVNHNQSSIIVIDGREICKPIHGDRRPRPVRDWEGFEGGMGLLAGQFGALTKVTGLNVSFGEGGKSGKVKITG
jgi:hypothetical protein